MRLRWSPTSPFVRKVVAAMKEKGVEELVEKEKSNPLSRTDRAATPNPLGKIPCLIADDGAAIYDSPVIVEYLDDACDGPDMVPRSGPARWAALRRQALADGMLEAMVACFVESLRKPERRSEAFMAHQKSVAFSGIEALEGEAAAMAGVVDVGTIAAAVALSYAGTAFPDDDWRAGRPALAAWFADFSRRPSMTETELVDPFAFE